MYGKVKFIRKVVSINYIKHYSSSSTKKLLEFLAEMPKANSARIADAQRQRQNISKKAEKYGPSTVYLQVLGSGARGVPNTLYLFTDQKRYLFNCGECTQRLAHEHKVKLSRLENIFITSKTWKSIGGLPGLSLTLQDVGVPSITLHGPEGLDELYNATRRFVIMKDMNVNMAKCIETKEFEDSVMTVKYVLLGPQDIFKRDTVPLAKKAKLEDPLSDQEYEEFIHDNTDYYKRDNKSSDATEKYLKHKVKPVEKDIVKKKADKMLQDFENMYCSVAYICTIKKRLGTLDLNKCVERGVKPGPLLGQLKSGLDVVLPDGSIVLSKDVKTPDDPGPVFIVLEVPEVSYLCEADFAPHFANRSNPPEAVPALVVHYTPPHVLRHPKYQAFMLKFGSSTQHLVLNSQNSCLGSEAVHRTQHKLHLLDADIFPLLRDVSVPPVWTPSPVQNTTSPTKLRGLEELKNKFQTLISMEGSGKVDEEALETPTSDQPEQLAGRSLTVYHLRPRRELDRSTEPKLHIQNYIQEAMNVDGFVGSLEQFRKLVDGVRFANRDSQSEFPKVIFLGTGSCIPSKTRNTSAIVLQVDENKSLLLDCGEGTFGQLVRFFGPKRVNAFLRTLKAIYVSHLHADHHIGLIGVLQARREALLEVSQEEVPPVYLLAPGQIVTWLSMYDQQFESIRADFTLIPNQNLMESTSSGRSELSSALLAAMGLQRVVTCRVAHCPNAFGVALHLNRHKITYSGDTIPCDELVNIGQDSTLLIHEATMEDELAAEARVKMHSTTSQAIEVGRRMGAHFTLLTHFSQRYARLPRLSPHILNDNNSVGIAFDNMQISMSDLELLPHMYAPLQLMFAEHCIELELKAESRARRKERQISTPNIPTSDESKRPRSPSNQSSASAPASVPIPSSTPASATAPQDTDNESRKKQQEMKTIMSAAVTSARTKLPSTRKASTLSFTANSNRNQALSPEKNDICDRSKTAKDSSMTRRNTTIPSRSPRRTSPASNHINVIDSRSKTLNLPSRETSLTRVLSTTHNGGISRRLQDVNFGSPKRSCQPVQKDTGYGKPLLAPADAKLCIRRESRPSTKAVKISTPGSRSRSPINGCKRESNVCTVSPNRIYMSKLPINASRTRDNDRTNVFTTAPTVTKAQRRDAVDKTIKLAQHRRSVSSKREPLEKPSPNMSPTRRYSSSKIPTLISSPLKVLPKSNKDNDTSQLTYRYDKVPRHLGSKYSVGSDKSFKPQLEDIKSSFILLDQKNPVQNVKEATEKVNKLYIPKATEFVRRSMLAEVKQKYKSKQYRNESKFQKIEGLNWISWK